MGYAEENRQAAILNFLRQEKKASVADLSQMFEASEATIRRDLTKLENKGHLVKTYGGALLSTSTQFEFSYNERLLKNVREKKRIGALAARMVKSGLSIFLDSGTTALQIAMNLKHLQELTVITNAVPIVQELAASAGIRLYLLGGCYRPKSQDLVGPILVKNLAQFSVDIAFLSVDGFHVQHGLSASDLSEAEVVQAALKVSKRSVVVADHSKADKRAFAWICPFDDIDLLISDSDLDRRIVDELQQQNIQVDLA
ncbi:MAG: HTH-type transcriptional repressor GlcR [bacterium]|nr:DeoR/GlpR transcriptional regulator [bacterium]MBV6482514.1 HTH-type transcriptional repressor GlcR [bacterium]